jgi:hypothetical protein
MTLTTCLRNSIGFPGSALITITALANHSRLRGDWKQVGAPGGIPASQSSPVARR